MLILINDKHFPIQVIGWKTHPNLLWWFIIDNHTVFIKFKWNDSTLSHMNAINKIGKIKLSHDNDDVKEQIAISIFILLTNQLLFKFAANLFWWLILTDSSIYKQIFKLEDNYYHMWLISLEFSTGTLADVNIISIQWIQYSTKLWILDTLSDEA